MRINIFYLLSLVIVVASCSPIKKANKRFLNGEYNVAIDQYENLLNNPKYKAEAHYKIAESYRLSNRIKEATPHYQAAYELGYDKASSGFYYGYALKHNGQYDKAREELSAYLESAEETEFYTMANRELENLDYLDVLRDKESYFEIDNVSAINSPSPEYSPFVKDDRFYFTSTREDGKIYKATGTKFSDIYVAKVNDLKVEDRVQGVGDFINSQGVNEGTLAISPNGRTIIFARGNTGKRKGTNDVNLYISRYRNQEWTEPSLMNINDKNAWSSCPAFSREGHTLYFASNRKGGFGGTDIYVAHLNRNGRWGKVKNLGPVINTPGNEMFPFVSEDARLYFASDGHAGFGGLDLFVAERKRGRISIENLGKPVNSVSDDFGWFMTAPNKGFFTSNREGGKGDDDIYSFINHDPNIKVVQYWLEGITKTTQENNTETILPNVKLRLMDEDDNQLDVTTTTDDGSFRFRLDPESNYILIGEKPSYFTTRMLYSTEGKSVDQDTLKDFLTEVVFDTVMVLDRIVLDKAIVLENIYYDLDKAYIREDAARELDKLVAILNDNPEISIELSSHTDSRQTHEYNMELSQRRAQSAVDYIVSSGIDASRLVAKGYGETRLLISDNEIARMENDERKEEAHQKNRRTEFKVIEFNQKKNDEKVKLEDLEDRLFDDY
jgi:outer membrane protein OmpA-like peptidoglycan-associated protein/Tol biopolymer transport system component